MSIEEDEFYEEDLSEFDDEFFLSKQVLVEEEETEEEVIESDQTVDAYSLENLHHGRVGRLLVVQLLYAYDMQTNPDLELLQQFLWDEKAQHPAKKFAKRWSDEVLSDRGRWDREISTRLIGWEWSRISPVLRAILRISVCELLIQERPGKVIIFEALEITKLLVDDDKSRKFVNGILDKVMQKNIFDARN